jgi:hypothetical protein
MKVRKLTHNRRGVAADAKHLRRAYLSRKDAALLLHVSREYLRVLSEQASWSQVVVREANIRCLQLRTCAHIRSGARLSGALD